MNKDLGNTMWRTWEFQKLTGARGHETGVAAGTQGEDARGGDRALGIKRV